MLLARIQSNKRKTSELQTEIDALKKKYYKKQKEIRLKKINATDTIETIDIS